MLKEIESKHKRTDKHWYFIYYEECVLCGRSHTYRERKYSPRPEDWDKRHYYRQYACGDHFL